MVAGGDEGEGEDDKEDDEKASRVYNAKEGDVHLVESDCIDMELLDCREDIIMDQGSVKEVQ